MAKTAEKLDYSLDTQRKKLDKAYAIAEQQANPAGMTAAVREQNAVSGHHIQTILTDGEQAAELSETEQAERKAFAQWQLRQGLSLKGPEVAQDSQTA